MLVSFCCAAAFIPELVLLELCSCAPGALLCELLLPKLLVLADSETSPLPFCNSVDTFLIYAYVGGTQIVNQLFYQWDMDTLKAR